jgi:membrane protease YdiL (CAAX protease family)
MKREVGAVALGRFLGLAFGISWLFWLPLVLLGWDATSLPGVFLLVAGGLGPAAAELILILRAAPEARHDYWQRLTDVRRIDWRWGAAALLLVPALTVLALIWDGLLNGNLPQLENARSLMAEPWRFVVFASFIFFFGPVPEELGWRGYALDGLQARFAPLPASLVLGSLWMVWHLPLFLMNGTFQQALGVGTLQFWWFVADIVLGSILYTWLYNNTGRSTLIAILFHFSTNFTGEFLNLSATARVYQGALIVFTALVVAIFFGPQLKRAVRGRQKIVLAFSRAE